MSTVVLQIGQCGNQVGESLFSLLNECLPNTSAKRDVFFNETKARAVLIDMEPKVVQRCLDSAKPWGYDRRSAFWKQSGAGNNWAFGFNAHGPQVKDNVSNAIRRQVESCDRLDSFILLKSTAGGTGSGVGAYTLRQVSEQYPKTTIVSTEMWPFITGEVSVQSFNTVLSLAAAVEFSDLVCKFDNSTMAQIAIERQNIPKPMFGDINRVVASHLCHQFLPSPGGISAIATHVGCHPGYNLSVCRFVPQTCAKKFTTDTWSGLHKGLVNMYQTRRVIDFDRRPCKDNVAVASNLCVRGSGADTADLDVFKAKDMYWKNSIDPLRIVLDKSTQFEGHPKSASLLSVDQSCLESLKTVFDKAKDMLHHNAFVHQYESYGISREDIAESLFNIYELVSRYEQLAS